MTNRDKFEEIVTSDKDKIQIVKELRKVFPNINVVTDGEGFSIELDLDFLTKEYHNETNIKDDRVTSTCS